MTAHAKRKTATARRAPSKASQEKRLRERIAMVYADPSIDPKSNIEGMQSIFHWINTGRVPGKPELKLVKEAG